MDEAERLRRWRLVLGAPSEPLGGPLSDDDAQVDEVLASLYDAERAPRGAGLGASAPRVARWLGDIRALFPQGVVQIMQRDALERLGLARMLLEPELLAAVEPDVALVSILLTLARALPPEARESARAVVREVVRALERRLQGPLAAAVRGALARSGQGRQRPRSAREIDWPRTLAKNLGRWDATHRRLVPERFEGYPPRRAHLREVVLLVDQSGSMASSVVHAGVLAAILASLPALRTRVAVFDTAVVDLSDHLADPVALLFGTQLGGGTDIARALRYAEGLVTRPTDTVLFLVSDLFEGGDARELIARARALVARGVTLVTLLALDDGGAPAFDRAIAAQLAALGVPVFACTPERFPDLLAAALARRDLGAWAAAAGLHTARPA